MFKYTTLVATVAAATLYVFWLQAQNKIERLNNEVAAYETAYRTCTTRTTNILEDKETDDEVDEMLDGDLSNVPAEWLLPVE